AGTSTKAIARAVFRFWSDQVSREFISFAAAWRTCIDPDGPGRKRGRGKRSPGSFGSAATPVQPLLSTASAGRTNPSPEQTNAPIAGRLATGTATREIFR